MSRPLPYAAIDAPARPTQPSRGCRDFRAQDDDVPAHLNAESISSLDPERAPNLARNGDLVLAADLHA